MWIGDRQASFFLWRNDHGAKMKETEAVEARACERFGEAADKGAFTHAVRAQNDQK
jgi:hypothetical protein